jgi:hypothetical protein
LFIYSDGFTEVPIDLLILHFLLPWISARVAPSKRFTYFLDAWFVYVASHLRISSFLIGGEYPLEEMGDHDDYDELILNKSESDPINETDPLLKTKNLRYMRVPNRKIDLT